MSKKKKKKKQYIGHFSGIQSRLRNCSCFHFEGSLLRLSVGMVTSASVGLHWSVLASQRAKTRCTAFLRGDVVQSTSENSWEAFPYSQCGHHMALLSSTVRQIMELEHRCKLIAARIGLKYHFIFLKHILFGD